MANDESSTPAPGVAADDTRLLVQRTSQGDQAALGALLERQLPALRVFVRLQTGPFLRQRESCSDLVQSVCRELLENLGDFEYRGEEQFRHWLYVATLNKIRARNRYYRAERRDPEREVDDDNEQIGALYATLLTPSRDAMVRETVERLERAFDELPEHYRDVVLLCRVVGLSQEEVARRMDRTVDSVRNLLHRALARVAYLADGVDG